MLKKLFLGVYVVGSFFLFSVYAATATECLEGCKRNQSTTRADLQKCKAGCKDMGGSVSVSTSPANANVEDRSKNNKSNPNSK